MIKYMPNAIAIEDSDVSSAQKDAFAPTGSRIVEIPLAQIINECLKSKITALDLVVLEMVWHENLEDEIFEEFAAPKHVALQIIKILNGKELFSYGGVDVVLNSKDMGISKNPERVFDFLSKNTNGRRQTEGRLSFLDYMEWELRTLNSPDSCAFDDLTHWHEN